MDTELDALSTFDPRIKEIAQMQILQKYHIGDDEPGDEPWIILFDQLMAEDWDEDALDLAIESYLNKWEPVIKDFIKLTIAL